MERLMTERSGFRIRIEGRPGGNVGDLMIGIRNWQDHRNIRLVSVAPARAEHGATAVNARFRCKHDLVLFCRDFERRYFFSIQSEADTA
jgi:hypothetical protein